MTILCPLDFSAASAGVVGYAAALAAAMGAELRLLHVCEPQADPSGQRPDATVFGPCQGRMQALRAAAEPPARRGCTPAWCAARRPRPSWPKPAANKPT